MNKTAIIAFLFSSMLAMVEMKNYLVETFDDTGDVAKVKKVDKAKKSADYLKGSPEYANYDTEDTDDDADYGSEYGAEDEPKKDSEVTTDEWFDEYYG